MTDDKCTTVYLYLPSFMTPPATYEPGPNYLANYLRI